MEGPLICGTTDIPGVDRALDAAWAGGAATVASRAVIWVAAGAAVQTLSGKVKEEAAGRRVAWASELMGLVSVQSAGRLKTTARDAPVSVNGVPSVV